MNNQAFCHLAMYPFPALVPLWRDVWAQIHRGLPWTPSALTWPDHLPSAWVDPAQVVGMTCGWPLIAGMCADAQVIGRFVLNLPCEKSSSSYRSVLVSSDPTMTVERARTAAVNELHSLSGWVSLLATGWAGDAVVTGAHVASLMEVRKRRVELAVIDGATLAYVRRYQPELVHDLFEVGLGPLIPTLPIVTSSRTSPQRLAELRAAFVAVGAVEGLFIGGFEPCTAADYFDALRPVIAGLDITAATEQASRGETVR